MSSIFGLNDTLFQQIKSLNIRAKIAIAARCCRRVEPVALNLPPSSREELKFAIEAFHLYAKGTQEIFPQEALTTLQQLEYTDTGTDSAYAVLCAAKAISSYDKAQAQYNSAKTHFDHIQGICETWRRVGWHTAPATMNMAVSQSHQQLGWASSQLASAKDGLEDATHYIDEMLVSCIDHSVADSAAGAAINGGKASTAAARAALQATSSDIDMASRLNAAFIDPEESGPLGSLWPVYKPEFSVPDLRFNEYYSCFISYSSKDQVFVDRLHADLQKQSVRCWFAPEDLKIGDKIRPAIDEAIRGQDKLLLVLSDHSVNSSWVEHEVETALAREREHNQTVLFPIRLDNAVMDIKIGWAAHILNTRNIGNFCQWDKDDGYRKAFDRLLRDLKAIAPKKSATTP